VPFQPDRGEVWALVNNLLEEERPAQQPDKATESEPPKNKAALFLSYSEPDEEESIEKYMGCFKAEPSINMEECPLQWWSYYAGAHTRLACIAPRYLAMPATSVPCCFHSLDIYYKRREQLYHHVNRLV
jgi:hypothetical protein